MIFFLVVLADDLWEFVINPIPPMHIPDYTKQVILNQTIILCIMFSWTSSKLKINLLSTFLSLSHNSLTNVWKKSLIRKHLFKPYRTNTTFFTKEFLEMAYQDAKKHPHLFDIFLCYYLLLSRFGWWFVRICNFYARSQLLWTQ